MEINPSFIQNCRNPYRVVNQRGKEILCRCGKCSDCQNSKSVKYTEMIKRASSEYKYTYFFTLTYNERCVPKVVLFEDKPTPIVTDEELELFLNITNSEEMNDADKSIYARSITTRPLKDKKRRFKPVPEYGSILFKIPFTKFDNENFKKFYSKSNIISKYATQSEINFFNSNRVLRVLRKKDVQNFIKKLRFNISTCDELVGDTTISYYFVGEYGPRTFRPHYHGLLFFNNESLLQKIKELLIQSWNFGRVEEPGLADNSGACCSYVASYCNSYSYLPDYLSFKPIRPFSLHSCFLGTSHLPSLRKIVYENPSDFFGESDISIDGTPFHFSPTTQMLSSLFPRCYNYSNKLPHERTILYEAFNCFAQRSSFCRPSDITKYILVNSDDYLCRRYLTLLDIVSCGKPPLSLSLDSPEVTSFDIPYSEYSEYMITIYNRVYSAISLSRQFIRISNEYFNSNYYEFSRLIDSYYNNRALYLLKVQYETIIEYYKYHANPLTFWDILHNTRKYPITDYQHHLYYSDIFYFNALTYRESLRKCGLLKKHFDSRDSYYRKNVKHKELNDANLIFVNVLNN